MADVSTAERAINILLETGIDVREDMDAALWKDAGNLKVQYRLSVADTFAVALARRSSCSLISTDHHELDAINSAGTCQVVFVR